MAMTCPPQSPEPVQAQMKKLLLGLANAPIEIPSLLHAMATLLDLAAIQLSHVDAGGRRVVWDADQRTAYRLRSSLEHWVQGMRFSSSGREVEESNGSRPESDREASTTRAL